MAEEKETPACPCALTCFKDHISVELGAQTGQNDIWCDTIAFLNTLKVKRRVHINFHHGVNRNFTQIDLPLGLELLLTLT